MRARRRAGHGRPGDGRRAGRAGSCSRSASAASPASSRPDGPSGAGHPDGLDGVADASRRWAPVRALDLRCPGPPDAPVLAPLGSWPRRRSRSAAARAARRPRPADAGRRPPRPSTRAGGPAEAVARLDALPRGHADDAEGQYLLARILYADGTPLRTRAAPPAPSTAPSASTPTTSSTSSRSSKGSASDGPTSCWTSSGPADATASRSASSRSTPTTPTRTRSWASWAIRDYYQYRNAIALPGPERYDAPDTARRSNARRDRVDQRRRRRPAAAATACAVAVDPTRPDAIRLRRRERRLRRRPLRHRRAPRTERGLVTFESARHAAPTTTPRDHLRAALRADPRRRSVYDHVVRLALHLGPVGRRRAATSARCSSSSRPTAGCGSTPASPPSARAATRTPTRPSARRSRRMPPDVARRLHRPLAHPPARRGPGLPRRPASPSRSATGPAATRASSTPSTSAGPSTTPASSRPTCSTASDALDRPGWKTERGLLYVRYGPPQGDVIIDGSFAQVVEAYPGLDGVRPARLARQSSSAAVGRATPSAAPTASTCGVRRRATRRAAARLRGPQPQRPVPAVLAAGLSPTRSARRAAPTAWTSSASPARPSARRPSATPYAPPGRHGRAAVPRDGLQGHRRAGPTSTSTTASRSQPAAPAGADVDLTIQTGAFLVGARRDLLVERRRTVYGLRAAQIVPFAETRLWTTTEPLAAPPGANEVSVEFETAGGGASAVQRRAVDVPDFSQPGLQMSDVMLAYAVDPTGRAAPGRVVRGGVRPAAAPWGVFEAGAPVYRLRRGLRPAAARRPDRLRGRGRARPAGRLDGPAPPRPPPARPPRVRRRLDAPRRRARRPTTRRTCASRPAGQPPGLYTLTVTVHDRVSGATVERETDLLLEAGPTP